MSIIGTFWSFIVIRHLDEDFSPRLVYPPHLEISEISNPVCAHKFHPAHLSNMRDSHHCAAAAVRSFRTGPRRCGDTDLNDYAWARACAQILCHDLRHEDLQEYEISAHPPRRSAAVAKHLHCA